MIFDLQASVDGPALCVIHYGLHLCKVSNLNGDIVGVHYDVAYVRRELTVAGSDP